MFGNLVRKHFETCFFVTKTALQNYSNQPMFKQFYLFKQTEHFSIRTSVAHFWSILQDKVSWRPISNRTWCADNAKTIGHQTCRKQNPWLWTKHEKLKFTAALGQLPWSGFWSWSYFRFKHNALWLCTIYMVDYFSQNMVSLQSRCACQLVSVLHWSGYHRIRVSSTKVWK